MAVAVDCSLRDGGTGSSPALLVTRLGKVTKVTRQVCRVEMLMGEGSDFGAPTSAGVKGFK